MANTLVDNELFVDFDDPIEAEDSEGNGLNAAQVQFFSGSKCRDEEGNLLVVYHASKTDFTTFDLSKIGTGGGTIYGRGFYFCDNEYDVTEYGPIIKQYYLNLKKPFIFLDTDSKENAKQNVLALGRVLKLNGYPVDNVLLNEMYLELRQNEGGIDTLIEMTCGEANIVKYLTNTGYDGIMNRSIGDYVAFYPEQIKLCDNKAPSLDTNTAA